MVSKCSLYSSRTESSPTVCLLFDVFLGVEEIFLTSNRMVISMSESYIFTELLIQQIIEVINENISDGFYNEQFLSNIEKIKDVVENYVNLAIEDDGGAYVISNYSLKHQALTLTPIGFCRTNDNFNQECDLKQIKDIIKSVHNIDLRRIILVERK